MKKCKNCGNVVSDDTIDICPKCGKSGPWLIGRKKTNNNNNSVNKNSVNNRETNNEVQGASRPLTNFEKAYGSTAATTKNSGSVRSNNTERNTGASEYSENSRPTSIGTWIINFIILSIPIVNLIYLIVNILGSKWKNNKTMKNYFTATMIMMIIGIILAIILQFVLASAIKQLMYSLY